MGRLSFLSFLLLCCFFRSNGFSVPRTSTTKQPSPVTLTSILQVEESHKILAASSSRMQPPAFRLSPLFSNQLNDENELNNNKTKPFKLLLVKLSAILLAAALFFNSGPALARRERFFTPEMETSLSTLVAEDRKEEVTFWYPEMDEIAEQEQSAQTTTGSTTSQQKPSKTASAIHKNRGGGAAAAVAAAPTETKLMTNLISMPFVAINALLVVAAALFGMDDTAETLRYRFSYYKNPPLAKWKSSLVQGYQSHVLPRMMLVQEKWKLTICFTRATWVATTGMGSGLEQASVILAQAPKKPVAVNVETSTSYSFDYNVVEAFAYHEGDHAAHPTPLLQDISQKYRQDDVNSMMRGVMLQNSHEGRISKRYDPVELHKLGLHNNDTDKFQRYDPVQLHTFGLRRRSNDERFRCAAFLPSSTSTNN